MGRTNAIRVSALVANYVLENARKRTMARLVNKLKKSTRFKNIQLEERLRDLTLVNERERTEKEKLKRERDESDKKRNDALQMLEAKKQETLHEEKKKLEDDRKRFEEQQAEQRRQFEKMIKENEKMMKAKEREIDESNHRQLIDNRVQNGTLRKCFLELQRKHVVCLQSLFRERNAMNYFKTEKRSAITIQSWLRKESAASKYKKYLSAKKIQSVVRKVQAGKGYKKCKDAVIRLQYFIRTRQCNLKDKQKLSNVHYDKFVIKTLEARHAREENAMLHNQNNALVLEIEQVRAENAALVSNIEGMHKDLICPILLHRFVDPVVACDGYVYERAAIQQWFDNNHRVSPMTNEPLNDTTLIPCRNMKTIARAFDDVTGNNNNVQSMDAQLQVVRGEFQQRFEESVRIRENLGMENADLRQQLATANDSIGVKDQEIANLRQLLANANDTIESLRIQTKTYAGGNVYVGQMKDGKKHGFGSYTWANGNVYVGAYKDSLRDGKGTYTCNSGSCKGDVYVGE